MVPISDHMNAAVAHHQAGRLADAESLYRQILARLPHHGDALHLLGVLLGQTHRLPEGVALIQRAIAIRPGVANYHSNLGKFLMDMGQPNQAIAAYRQAIAINPNIPEAHNNLGTALQGAGQTAPAVDCYRHALRLKPDYAEAHNNLGSALKDLYELQPAEASCRRALELKPDYAEALSNLAGILAETVRVDEALACALRAVALKPDLAAAYNSLGSALHMSERREESLVAYRHALKLNPHSAEIHNNIANALRELDELDAAIDNYRRALQLNPQYAEGHSNLGVAYKQTGQFAQAEACQKRALELRPNFPDALCNLGVLALIQGDFANGWKGMEWRWQCRRALQFRQPIAQPQWDGRNLDGQTLLLHAEQGYGDNIQFVRYATLAAGRGGRVIIECQRELQRLFQSLEGVAAVIAIGDPLPAFQFHCPMVSLPFAFGTTLETVPSRVPYLHPDAADAAQWRSRLSPIDGQRIGLAWAGNPLHRNDRNRSRRLEQFAPLAKISGTQFFSLQKGDPGQQVPSAPFPIIDHTSDLKDFAATAALIANLDLVITVDTAVAHLAGALGKPVWTLLPHMPEWRWMTGRADSPWYPTMQLFRQSSKGNWNSVIESVVHRLASR